MSTNRTWPEAPLRPASPPPHFLGHFFQELYTERCQIQTTCSKRLKEQGPIQGVTAGTQYRGPPTLGAPQVEFFYDKEKLAPDPNGYLHLLIISLLSTKVYTFINSQGHPCGSHIKEVFVMEFKKTKAYCICIYLKTFKLMFS